MSKLIRAFYRIFIKNRLIRWVWMLALAIWGVRVVTERGLALKKAPLSKTVLSLPASSISEFTIRRSEDDETTFTLADTCWLVVKNNITIRLPIDSMSAYLSFFEKINGVSVNLLSVEELDKLKPKYNFDVIVTQNNNTKHSFSVFYKERDSQSYDTITYVKFQNENTLHGIKGDLLSLFSKTVDDYRDKTLLKFNKDSTIYLTIKTPTDSFSFVRREQNWISRNRQYRILPDPFREYVTNLQILRGAKFYDGDRDILTEPKIEKQLFVYLPTDTIVLTSFKLEKGFILHSTQNNEAYFRVDSTTNIFPNLSNFLQLK